MVLLNEQGNYLIAPELPLATKGGTPIPNEQRPEDARVVMTDRKEQVIRGGPERRPRSLSATYNCMGMVFANRRAWIDPEHLRLILEGDGYRQVADMNELETGDVVVYRNAAGEVSHVGLVTQVRTIVKYASREVYVLSQWGAYGEYFHRADDVSPMLGKPSEYWTERTI